MGRYLGKRELEDAIDRISRDNKANIKGLEAELEVGAILEKCLPDDTVIIAHPQIGKYDPDFLIISPRYGFRILEVKNWSITSIVNVESNGTCYLTNNKKANPMTQAKTHRDELREYIKINHGISNSTVGYVVLHYGFDKSEFKNKFDNNWGTSFYETNLFKDQLGKNIDKLLETSVMSTSLMIGQFKIDSIIQSIKIKVSEESKEGFSTIKELKKLVYVVISLLVVIIIILYGAMHGFGQEPSATEHIEKDITISEMIGEESNVGKQYQSSFIVKDFYFDKDSGTKFLTLSDGSDTIKGVIFKGVENIPYIEEDKSYIISGTLSLYNSEYEIEVSSVTP